MRRGNNCSMKRMHSQFYQAMCCIVLFLVILGLCGCGGGGGNSAPKNPVNKVESITVQSAVNKLAVGNTQQFTAKCTYTDSTTDSYLGTPVIWSSSNTSIATITPNGMVTAVAAGQTTITATVGELSDMMTLTVVPAPLASITVQSADNKLAVGNTQQFTARCTYTDNTIVSYLGTPVIWSSSNTSVATITPNGMVTAVAAGQTTITATIGELSGTMALTVPAPSTPVAVAVQPADNKLAVGKTQQFTAIYTHTDGTTYSDSTIPVIWSSSSPSVATITPNGMVTAVAAGQTTITATVNGLPPGTTTLTVPATTLASITITPSNQTIAINTVQQFTATGAYLDGTVQDLTSTATWRSTTTAVATIAAGGKASAIGAGSTTISATSGSISGTATLSVSPASVTLQSIAVTPVNPTIVAGTSQQFIATGTFSNSTTQDLTAQVTWSSSATSIATIAQNGKASAVGAGSTTITATSGGKSGTTTLTVAPLSVTLQSIAVTPSSPTISAGTTQQFSATGTLSNGLTQDLTTQVTWSSSDTSIASITQSGKASTIAAGTTKISATLAGLSGSQYLTVTPANVTGTWEGTYSIYDSPDPKQIAGSPYTYKFVLTQNGTGVTGTSSLRYNMIGQLPANGQFIEATVSGNQISFTFTYPDPLYSYPMINIGTATITDTSMIGNVMENYKYGYNCSYSFSLQKKP